MLVAGLAAVLVGVLVLGAVARGGWPRRRRRSERRTWRRLPARAMHGVYARLFEPAVLDGRPNPRRVGRDEYLPRGRVAAERVAAANGARGADIEFPDGDTFAPVRIRVAVREHVEVRRGGARRRFEIAAQAEAELAPPGSDGLSPFAAGGGYDGPLAYRQRKPMRPDVALAFDRMERAARADGVQLLISSAYRSDAEQAELWRRNPDPKWVAQPGTSLHRYATEESADVVDLDGFRDFARAGFVLMATSFELEALCDGTRLSTETRVQPTDPAAARAFRAYWWAIRAGSGLIRRDMLHAVRRRAEHDATPATVATQSS